MRTPEASIEMLVDLLREVVFIIGSLFQCAAQSFSHLFIGRAVGGFGVGALRSVQLQAEWSAELRRRMQHVVPSRMSSTNFPAYHGTRRLA